MKVIQWRRFMVECLAKTNTKMTWLAVALVTMAVSQISLAAGSDTKRDAVRKDDVVYPKVALVFAPGETSKVLEVSSYSVSMDNPTNDKCVVRLGRSDASTSRAVARMKLVQDLRIENLQPKFEIEKFVSEFRRAVPKIFNSMILADNVEGVVFRRDELKMEMSQILAAEPMRQVPKGFRARLEQALITNLWGCYGDVNKFKGQTLQSKIGEYHQVWEKRLVSEVEGGLRQEARKAKIKSDQMAKTRVVMVLKPTMSNVPDPSMSVDCVFEGAPNSVTIERMNTVLSPYLEVFPRDQFKQLHKSNYLPLREAGSDKGQVL